MNSFNRLVSISIGLLVLSLLYSVEGVARPSRVSGLPNYSGYSCSGCHDTYPPENNSFGMDVWRSLSGDINDGLFNRTFAQVRWDLIYHLDSDGDGYSNGQELGDPHGRWSTSNRVVQWTFTSDPSSPFSTPQGCGDGQISSTEECEGTDLDGETCESQGFVSGTLSCTTTCIFDFSECSLCGNEVIDAPTEDCDGQNFNGQTCVDFGFLGGELGCSECGINLDQCHLCGDGVVQEDRGESCDQNDLNNLDCTDLGFLDSQLNCDENCGLDTSECLNCIDRDDDLICDDDDVCPDQFDPNQDLLHLQLCLRQSPLMEQGYGLVVGGQSPKSQ